MPDWLAFLFGVIAGALLIAAGLWLADLRRDRREQRAITDLERQNDERAAEAMGRLWAAARVERERGEG